jgi:proliferating cell nuclear antigen
MFEASLEKGITFKNVLESIKDLVTDANIECTEEEIQMQCMDSAHVALVSFSLPADLFSHYRCDRNLNLGINTPNMSKIFKMMNKDDSLTLKAEDDADILTMMFESTNNDTIADFGKFEIEHPYPLLPMLIP